MSGVRNQGQGQGQNRKSRNPRDGMKLYILVRMVLDRSRGQHETGQVGRELGALTWALDRLGYPPARYDEVLKDCAPPRVREQRQTRVGKPGKEESAP